ncbi:hypothetical protein F5I97DRAFT_1828838 [Phlebopus sp. FC_14]|nr:hypothetical protein F5I97DRAFT_1828838 [Phlebopus sp. FC_14]
MRTPVVHIRFTPIPSQPSIRRCSLHLSARRSTAFSLPASDTAGSRPDAADAKLNLGYDRLRERKLNALVNSLSQDASDVWMHYVDLTNALELDNLPLEIHQKVLRKCVPSPSVLRPMSAREMQGDSPPRPPHIYEARLKTVMRNIRLMGNKPVLDDYHYVLEQFQAVGHMYGSMQVYHELKHVCKLTPERRTFGLCLQSIAHRLSLPMYHNQRSKIIHDAVTSCKKILGDMRSYEMHFTSVILDLVIRISKESADGSIFTQLMKVGYGIDLDFPDHPPMQTSVAAQDEAGIPQIHHLLPFSTAALNTSIDMLGRLGNVPRLVQTFEVLTQPLPPQASQHFSKEFEDDDGDDFGFVNPASTQPHHTPHALPNSTTYSLLLKYISRSKHTTLARHYLQQASWLDRQVDRAIRTQLYCTPYKTPAPHFSISRGMILPVFGAANRDKDLALMRFVAKITRRSFRRKKNDIAYYTNLLELQRQGRQPLAPDHDPWHPEPTLSPPEANSSPAGSRPLLSRSSQFITDSDFDAPTPPPPVKYFNIATHLEILHRDFEDIATFYNDEVLPALDRILKRIKEKLERRVRNQKDLFIRTQNRRLLLARLTSMVNSRQSSRAEEAPKATSVDRREMTKGKGGSSRVASSRRLTTLSVIDPAIPTPLVPPLSSCSQRSAPYGGIVSYYAGVNATGAIAIV